MADGIADHAADARALLDHLRLSRAHLTVLSLLFLTLVVEGIDQQVVSYLSPSIAGDLHLSSASVGLLFSLGLIGDALGALIAGTFGDIAGSKRTVVAATIGVGLATCAMAEVTSLWQLDALRIFTGFCIGGALTNALALTAQFSPTHQRAHVLTAVVSGFPVGATLVGLTSTVLLAGHNWRRVSIFAGLFPLVLAPLLQFLVPESIPVVLRRRGGEQTARRTLQRLGAEFDQPAALVWPEPASDSRAPLMAIFRAGRARTSLTLTALFVVCLINVYFLSNWLSILMQRSGIDHRGALVLTTIFNLGGIIGVLVIGRLMDHFDLRFVVTGVFLSASLSLAVIALGRLGAAALMPLIFIAGTVVLGGQGVLNALPALLYPATMRATAGGWVIGTGRAGSVAGPLLGAELLSAGWTVRSILLASAALPLLATVLIMTLDASSSPKQRRD